MTQHEKRPTPSVDERLEALERLVVFMIIATARNMPSAEKHIETIRLGMTEGLAENASKNERAERVADYMDWLLSVAAEGVRKTP